MSKSALSKLVSELSMSMILLMFGIVAWVHGTGETLSPGPQQAAMILFGSILLPGGLLGLVEAVRSGRRSLA